jgi:sec-independent protein translocase protein TatA
MLIIFDTVFLWSAPSGGEWLWIVVIALLLFGGRKIPELARGLGKGIREFNDAKDGLKNEIENGIKEKNTTKASKEEA